jgi:hypothetical protein
MRKFMVVAVGVLVLATAGLAVGQGLDGTKTAKAVAGTFTATTSSNVQTRTCTTSDGKTIAVSHGWYGGTAAGDPDLAGPITLEVHSVINTTDDVGVVRGKLKIDVASGKDTTAHYEAVYGHANLAGLARGHAHAPGVQVLASLSAGFSTAGGFTTGKLGGGTAAGSAVELGPGRCAPNRLVHETSQARGAVLAVSSTSITVAGLTCAVPAGLVVRVAGLSVGDRAEIRCELVAGTNTLVKVSTRPKK